MADHSEDTGDVDQEDEQINSSPVKTVGRFRSTLTPVGVLGGLLIIGILLFALIGPALVGYDPNAQSLSDRLLRPFTNSDSGYHLLGTDGLGRDILARAATGARTSLAVAGSALLLGGTIGITAGLLAGVFGGWRDNLIMRLVDVQLAIPNLIFAMLISAVLGPSIRNTILALGFTSWATFARIVRAEASGVRQRPFIEASWTMGVRNVRMIWSHVLPNVLGSILVVGSLELGRMILVESALSFLGLGIRPPDASWGSMIQESQQYVFVAWWIPTMPGLFIMATVLGFNLLGDWLRDLTDPRSRKVR